MEEIVIVTSSKDAGVAVCDIHTGSSACTDFKNCLSDASCICTVGGDSSFSGRGGSGDFFVISQSKKPVINIYQWNKPQTHMVCHVQEITTAISSDPSGTFLFGGTKGGRIYCWEISTGNLLQSWQAHFKMVSKLVVSCCGMYLVSSSEDGMVRVWHTTSIVQVTDSRQSPENRNQQPFRSWSPHSLPVTGMVMLGGISSSRVLSCARDRALVLHDIHADKQCFSIFLPSSLESLAVNLSEDMAFAGSSNGTIFIVDMSVVAASLSAKQTRTNIAVGVSSEPRDNGDASRAVPTGVSCLDGHTRAVTGISCCADNSLIVSVSEDGSLRVWDIWSRQCLRELSPLGKMPLTNALIIPRPDILKSSVQKSALSPFGHLKKYANESERQIGPLLLGRKERSLKSQSNGPDSLYGSVKTSQLKGTGGPFKERDVVVLPAVETADVLPVQPGTSEGIGSKRKRKTNPNQSQPQDIERNFQDCGLVKTDHPNAEVVDQEEQLLQLEVDNGNAVTGEGQSEVATRFRRKRLRKR
eukprot:gene4605-9150_t